MSTDKNLSALIQIEERARAGGVRAKIRGIWRPRISIEAGDGEVLGEIRSKVVVNHFPHRAQGRLLGADVSIDLSGFLDRSIRLLADDTSLVSVDHRTLTDRFRAQDRQGDVHTLRRIGRLWQWRYALLNNGHPQDVIGFRCAPLRREVSFSLPPQAELKPGITLGLALLLYYDWYLSFRAAFLMAGGASTR